MFGKNQIVGQKHFKDAADKLLITSLFATLQGEGPFRGEPAFFVRFAHCNLACSFCDTYFSSGDWFTIEELDKQITYKLHESFGDVNGGNTPAWAEYGYITRNDPRRQMVLVITGGEPMLQKNIVPFLELQNKWFKNTQIESNGLIYQPIPDETTLVVSPKCLEKDGKAIRYLAPNHEVLKRADCLKFVMEAPQDSPYSSIPDWAHIWREETGRPVYVSPMNMYLQEPQRALEAKKFKNDLTIAERSEVNEKISWWEPNLLDMKANQANHEYTAKYCMENGMTFNMQLHLFASMA